MRQSLRDEEKTAEKQNIEEQLEKAAVAESKINQSGKKIAQDKAKIEINKKKMQEA